MAGHVRSEILKPGLATKTEAKETCAMTDLSGKTIVVTGAGRGQGLEEVQLLTAAGATVIGVELSATHELVETGAHIVEFDVSDPNSWASFVTSTGVDSVHGLVNNAAVPARARLLEVEAEEWTRSLAVNLTGPLLAMQTLAPLMRDGGSIVNISSLAGLTGLRTTAYTAAKWGLRGLSRVAANELGPRRIRVNTIFPGLIDTPLSRQNPDAFRTVSLEQIPLGRVGEVADIAPLVGFLLSDASSWISGAEIVVDGGQYAQGGMMPLTAAVDAAIRGGS